MAVTLKFNTAACISKIVATGRMTEKDAQQLLQDVANRGEKMRVTGVKDPFVTAAGKLAEKALRDAQNRTADAVKNAAIRTQGVAKIIAGRPEDWALNTRAILVSENGANKENVANMAGGMMNEWKGVVVSELRKAGLLNYAKSEAALSDISEAMFDIRQGLASTKPTPRANDPVYESARIIMQTVEAIRRRLNGEGARIGDAIDYVFHTSHDKELMRSGGRGRPLTATADDAFRAWWQEIRPLLNEEKTFDEVAPRAGETQAQAEERFGRSAFNSMYTGVHGGVIEPGAGGPAFEGSSNLGRKISQGRVFFFKDGKSWAQYMKSYGKQLNALELAVDTIHSGSSAVANLHFLGTNPAANMKMIVDGVRKRFKDSNPDAVVKYDEDLKGNRLLFKPALEDLLHQVGAIPSSPVNNLYHRIIDGALKVVNMDTLGSVGVTHAMSLPATFSTAGRSADLNTFQILGGLIHSMLPHSAARSETLAEMGALFDGLQVHNPYDNGVTVPGVISSMHSIFMTMTGIRYIMRHAKSGFTWMLSNHLVNQSTKFFHELGPMLRQSLQSFGIDSNKWDLIRTMAKIEGPSGRYYIAPSSALHLDEARIQSILDPAATPADIWHYKQEIADQLMMFYQRMSDLSTVTPGPREFAILRGSGKGADLSSLFTQFSAWPIAATHQMIAKTMFESQSKSKAAWALGVAAGLSMIAGYGRMAVRDAAAGRPPEIPQNPWQMGFLGLRAMAAGGILGILGDHLVGSIGQAAQNGHGLGGPIVGDIGALSLVFAKFTHALASGTKYDPWPDLVHLGVQNIPFANLFYAKGAFDYLLFYHLYEAAQPGWWERTNQARLRRGESAMQGYMPGAPIPYSPLTPEGIH